MDGRGMGVGTRGDGGADQMRTFFWGGKARKKRLRGAPASALREQVFLALVVNTS